MAVHQSTSRRSSDQPLTFRSATAVVVWIVWLLFAFANWIDLAVQGRDHMSAVAAALLLLGTGAAYVTAQRPRIIADEAGVTVRNPLRDHRIGWTGVARVDLAGLLRVHCEWGQHRKVISAWAMPYSKRRQFAAEASARRQARYPGGRRSPLGLPSGGGRGPAYGTPGPGPEASAAEAEAEKVARMLREQAAAVQAAARYEAAARTEAVAGSEAAARHEAVAGTGTVAGREAASTEPLVSTWSGRAIAALVIPALILLVVWLL